MPVGAISQKREKIEFSWEIPDFFLQVEKENYCYLNSPEFSFSGCNWQFSLSADSLRYGRHMDFYIWRYLPISGCETLCATAWVKKSDGTVEGSSPTKTETFVSDLGLLTLPLWDLDLSTLQKRRSELVPSGALTITCSLQDSGVVSQSSQTSEVRVSPPVEVVSQSSQTSEVDVRRPVKMVSQSSQTSELDAQRPAELAPLEIVGTGITSAVMTSSFNFGKAGTYTPWFGTTATAIKDTSTPSGFSFGALEKGMPDFGATATIKKDTSTLSGLAFGSPEKPLFGTSETKAVASSATPSSFNFGAVGKGTPAFGTTAAKDTSTPSGFSFGAPEKGTPLFGAAESATKESAAASSGSSFGALEKQTPLCGTTIATSKDSTATKSALTIGAPGKGATLFGERETATKESSPTQSSLSFGAPGTGTPLSDKSETTVTSSSTIPFSFTFDAPGKETTPFGATESTAKDSFITPSSFSFGAPGTGTPHFGKSETTPKNSSAIPPVFTFSAPANGTTIIAATENRAKNSSFRRLFYQRILPSRVKSDTAGQGTLSSGTSPARDCLGSAFSSASQPNSKPEVWPLLSNDIEVIGNLECEWGPLKSLLLFSSWKITWTVDTLPERIGLYGMASPQFADELDELRLCLYLNGLPTTGTGKETRDASTNPREISTKSINGDVILAIVAESVGMTDRERHFKLQVKLPDGTLLKSFRCKKHFGEQKFRQRYFVLPYEIARRISLSTDRCWMICELSLEDGEDPTAEVSSQIEIPSETGTLAKDLKDLLHNEYATDAVVRVKEQVFLVHRAILGARTPVFSAMFSHDTSERTSGIVDIEDCEPDTIRMFLQYVYSGGVDNLTAENAIGLYEVADKYQMEPLKQRCLDCIKGGLSVDNFCHAYSLALKHDERELTTLVTNFFADNMKKVASSDKWRRFMSENPFEANELLVKALDSD